MVKVIAGILLFFGCTALGFSKASGYKNRRVELEDTLELIRLLHLDISYRKDALAKTFQRAALQKFCWFADVLQECAEGLTAQKTLGKTWQDALYKEKEGCPLLSEDVEILTDLFLGLAGAIPGGSSRSWSRHFIAWSSRSAKHRNWSIKWEKCTEAWGWQPV